MSLFLIIFYGLLAIFGVIYCLLILNYTVGWFRLKNFVFMPDSTFSTFASVIIPARNEADNIKFLLDDLYHQSLEKSYFEVIVADDHSTDNTAALVKQFQEKHPDFPLKLMSMIDDQRSTAYKKKAIRNAIQESRGELIITTDADCRVGNNWLKTIILFYEKEKPKMIVGPVSFHREKTFFEKMQTGEFLSLIAITGGAIRINKPLMCNGANLAYEKKAFIEAGGFGGEKFSSGDDVFLMFQIRKIFGNRSIRFLKNYEGLVFTEAKKNISDFLQQRTRWASKNKGYELNILFVSFSVYMINLILLTGMVGLLTFPEIGPIVIGALMIKTLIDLPILMGIGNFVKRPQILLYVLPLVILYPFYIVAVGAMGVLGNYQWKGRKIKN